MRPTTCVVKVGRVAPRAPLVGHRWYLRDAPQVDPVDGAGKNMLDTPMQSRSLGVLFCKE